MITQDEDTNFKNVHSKCWDWTIHLLISLNKYIKVTKNIGSTLVRCCIQWTNIDSTSCVCWDMTEIQILEQYNCITCIKTIILVMFVVSILNKGRSVNNKKIKNEKKKKSDLLVFYIVIISWFQLAGYLRQFNKRVWQKSDIFCGGLRNGNMVRFTIKPALMILTLLYIFSDFFVF